MTAPRSLALAVTRLAVAAVFFAHGWPKVTDPAGTMEAFAGLGLPAILGPAVGWAEVICSGLLALGALHYVAVIPLFVIIVGALVLVQIPGGWSGHLERDLVIFGALGLLLAYGPGDWSLDGVLGDTAP